MNNNINWAMKKKLVVYGKYGIILPNYVGLKMNCKDPYLTTQYFMERIRDPGGFFVALSWRWMASWGISSHLQKWILTPQKFNMKSEKKSLEKESPALETIIFRFESLNFGGVQIFSPPPPQKKKNKRNKNHQVHGIFSWSKLILRMNINRLFHVFCCVFPIEWMDGLV